MNKENLSNHQTLLATLKLGNRPKNKSTQPRFKTLTIASSNTNGDIRSSVSDLRQKKISISVDGSDLHEKQGTPLCNDPNYGRYFDMMLNPKWSIKRQWIDSLVASNGLNPSVLDLDPNRSLESQIGTMNKKVEEEGEDHDDSEKSVAASVVEEEEEGEDDDEVDNPPLKDDPKYAKYFKLLKMGSPKGAVQNAMTRDGEDPSIMDLDPEKSVASQLNNNEEELVDKGPPLKEDPKYVKFFNMLKMGVPMVAVKNALTREGHDSSIMDLDPEKSVEYQQALIFSKIKDNKSPKQPIVRRKKIFWNTINDATSGSSLWSMAKGAYDFESLNVDQEEFESLFTDTSNPADKKKAVKEKPKESKQKKSVQVIDPKRGMNGGIILARIKVDFTILAGMVNEMDCGKLDDTQLKALREFLPTKEERFAIDGHIMNASSSKTKETAINDFCACEKYMLAMMKVDMADEKFEAMLFKYTYDKTVEELMTDTGILSAACKEVLNSSRLRKLMGMILTLGNQINTGGSRAKPHGFTLDALPKLNEAKAFDKKTTILQYLVKLIKTNDPDLLNIIEELPSISQAGSISFSTVLTEFTVLNQQLLNVKGTVSVVTDSKTEGAVDCRSMEMFVEYAETRSKEAQGRIEDVQNAFKKVLAYFHEDLTMDSFFGTWNKFLDEFYSALEKVEKAKVYSQKGA